VAITLHALSARTLKGSLALAAAVGIIVAVAGRAGPDRELAPAQGLVAFPRHGDPRRPGRRGGRVRLTAPFRV
jgi:hypothetical protein